MTYSSASSNSWRIRIIIIILLVIFGLISVRLFYVSYFQHETLSKIAESQYERIRNLKVRRGEIFILASAVNSEVNRSDKDELTAFAVTKAFPYAYIVPRDSENPVQAASELAKIFPLITEEYLLKLLLKKDDPFELLEKKISEEKITLIENLKLPEARVGHENDRFYPQETSLSQTIGFLGFKDDLRIGQYGLEGFYDNLLRENANLVLTINQTIQAVAESNLDELMKKWQASSGTIIIQEPYSGAILAMASSPSFNPNLYNKYPLGRFINPAIQKLFEPGSSFKVITMAAGIDSKKISPATLYEDRGMVKIGGYTIRNFDGKAYGIRTMTQVLEKSLNTGAVFAQDVTGDDNFLSYVINFGFGKKTNIDLDGEVTGNISNLYSGRKINFATASFGQGIAVTPLQLINAYSAIANGGKLMKPYIVKEIIFENNRKEETKPKIMNIPITEATSAQLKAMLVSVVESGSNKARIAGYNITAKTGTAQIPESGGYSEEFIHDMVGFAPAFSPRFTILVKLDKPQGINFAADSLTPAFKNITKFLLNYYNIPPTRQ